MRVVGLVLSFLVAVLLAGVALTYLEGQIGQHRIYVQEEWLSSSDQSAFPDTARIAIGNPVPRAPAK